MPMQHFMRLLRSHHQLITTNIMCRYLKDNLDIIVTIVTVVMTIEVDAMEHIVILMQTVHLDAAMIINVMDHMLVLAQHSNGSGG